MIRGKGGLDATEGSERNPLPGPRPHKFALSVAAQNALAYNDIWSRQADNQMAVISRSIRCEEASSL